MLSRLISIQIALLAVECVGQKYQNRSLPITSPGSHPTAIGAAATTSTLASSISDDVGAFILRGLGQTLEASNATSSAEPTITMTRTFNLTHTVRLSSLKNNASQAITANGTWEQAQSCNRASVSWREAHTGTWSWYANPIMTAIINESTILPNATTTTLCDGYARIEANVTSYTNTFILTAQASARTYIPPPCTTGCISCNIPLEACTKLWSSYNVCTHRSECPYSPACERPTNTKCTATRQPACTFTAGPVRLVYFPVTTVENKLCGSNSTLPRSSNITSSFSSGSAPSTIQAYDTTFTSGTAYISFATLAAVDQCGTTTGTPMSNFFLPLPSSEVSSMCGGDLNAFFQGPTSTRLNFADLVPPIATDVYKCQPKCSWGLPDAWKIHCPVIYDDYKPMLAYPTQVAKLQPEWEHCGFNPDTYKRFQKEAYFLFDPPVALSQAQEVVRPTVPAQTAHSTVQPVVRTSDGVVRPEETIRPGLENGGGSSEQAPESSDPKGESDLEDASTQQDGDALATAANPEGQTQPSGDQQEGQEDDPPPLQQPNSDSTSSAGDLDPSRPDTSPTGAPPILSILNEALGQVLEAAMATATFDQPQSIGSTYGDTSVPVSVHEQPEAASTIPAGLSVLNEALSQAQATDGTFVTMAGGSMAQDQIDAQVDAGHVIAVLPADSSTATVLRSGSDFVIGEQTVRAGTPVTFGGQILSLNSDGNGLVVGTSSTLTLADGQVTSITVVPESRATVLREGSVYIVAGQTLSAGGAITVNGQTVSVPFLGEGLVVNGKTLISTVVATSTALGPDSMTISRSGQDYVVDGRIISAGGIGTFNGLPGTLLPIGAGLAIGTSTISLAPGAATTLASSSNPLYLEISRSGSIVIVDDHTLTAGQTTIIDGQSFLILQDAAGIVVGSRTISLGNNAATTLDDEGTDFTPQSSVTTIRPTVAVNTGENLSGTATASQSVAGRIQTRCGVAILAVLSLFFVGTF